MKTSVFITNLEQYNNGRLVGQWVDLPFTDEQWGEIYKAIGKPEEMFISDYEADFNIDEVAAMFEAGYDREQIISNISDIIFYDSMTLEEVAEELVDECYDLPEFAKRYFDYKAFARDLSFSGYTETSYGVICAA